MLQVQKCKGCGKDASLNELKQYNGLCEHCWPCVSVSQELELWSLYAREPQWCKARHPVTGRPCWKASKKDAAECHQVDCVKHKP